MAEPKTRALDRALKAFGETQKYHEKFVRVSEDRYRSYRGILKEASEAASWTSRMHPAVILQSVEAMAANVIEDDLTFEVTPELPIGSPEEVAAAREGCVALEALLGHQASVDDIDGKQRTFALQAMITGLTAVKQYWKHKEGIRRGYMDEYGAPFETEIPAVFRDDPCSEIVDVRDFFWPEAATGLPACEYLFHRVWKTFDELKQLEKDGYYQNVDELKESKSFMDEYVNREETLFSYSRTKDRIEVLEMWTRDGRVITIGNRKTLLNDKKNPFWFDDLEHPYPFVICSSRSDLFRMEGISEVELLADLQEMLWSLMNQRLDSVKLLNNAIFMVQSNLLDRDTLNFFPGAIWELDDPQSVQPWTPNPAVGQISLESEAQVRGDLQNVTGGMPFLSGTNSATIDQETATGMSIITTLAQKMVAAKKREFMKAWGRVGDQWIRLNQQYVRSPRLLQVIGTEGTADLMAVMPQMIQGGYRCKIKATGESMIRQERVAEKQAHLQVSSQIAPIFQAVGTPISLQAVYEDYLEAMGIRDKDRYFSMGQPGLPGVGGQQPSQPGAGTPMEQPMGTTSPLAYAPTSPSASQSLSPVQNIRRALAMRGGLNNL